jgi:hypothetical protein
VAARCRSGISFRKRHPRRPHANCWAFCSNASRLSLLTSGGNSLKFWPAVCSFSTHGFAPTTTYELVWDERSYPPKAILGAAYEFATGERLGSGDFEGGKTGAVRVLGELGFTVQERRPTR